MRARPMTGVPAAPDLSSPPGVLDLLYFAGWAVSAFILGLLGYRRGRPAETTQATIAGAIVDNRALDQVVGPILQHLDALTGKLDKLCGRIDSLIALQEHEAEEDAQQDRVDRAVKKEFERMMRAERARHRPDS